MSARAASRDWSTGLCSCGEDWESCCMTLFCPSVAFGQVAETIDRGNTTCTAAGAACHCLMTLMHLWPCCPVSYLVSSIYACTYRRKLRAQYGLTPEPCRDCCVHLFCSCCALCQMYRELKNRGLNPSNGWAVNSQKLIEAPIPMQDMKR